MAVWWKTTTKAYVNSGLATGVWVSGAGSAWVVNVETGQGEDIALEGVYTAEAEALEVMRKLVQGFDPSSLA